MSQLKVLLLNPPGDKLYLRDYYCSSVSKAGYYWHPIDLLIQSGFLSRHFDVTVMDCIIQGLDEESAFKFIKAGDYRVIFSLVGSQSLAQDLFFLKKIKTATGARLIVSGEPFCRATKNTLKRYDFLEGILTDFTSDDLELYLSSEPFSSSALITIAKPDNRKKTGGRRKLSYPLPRHDLFSSFNYRLPFTKQVYASVITSFGCPFGCHYCNSGINHLGYKQRSVKEVMDELTYLVNGGCRWVFFRDMTFAAERKYSFELLKSMIAAGLPLSWNCYARVDRLDEDLLKLMRRAGCAVVSMGVESGDSELLEKMQRNFEIDQYQKIFKCMRKLGIKPGAHFILGLPGEKPDAARQILRLAEKLNPFYISLNQFSYREGAALAEDTPESLSPSNRNISLEIDKIYRHYYLNPIRFIKTAVHAGTQGDLGHVIRMGSHLLRNSFWPFAHS